MAASWGDTLAETKRLVAETPNTLLITNTVDCSTSEEKLDVGRPAAQFSRNGIPAAHLQACCLLVLVNGS